MKSARDDLARVLFESGEPGWTWDGSLVGDLLRRDRAYREADAVLAEWLPTVLSSVEDLRDVLVSTSDESGTYLTAAVMDKTLEVIRQTVGS